MTLSCSPHARNDCGKPDRVLPRISLRSSGYAFALPRDREDQPRDPEREHAAHDGQKQDALKSGHSALPQRARERARRSAIIGFRVPLV
jgi:hypothetical protein